MIKQYTSSKTERKERQFLELHDLNLHVSKVFWQQFDILIYFTPLTTTEKQTDSCLSSRDTYRVASLNFSRKKEKVSAQNTSTHVAPRSRWVSLWSASASASESAAKASSLWKKRAQSCESGMLHSSPHPHEQIWLGDFVIWGGPALSGGRYHEAGSGAQAPCPTTGTTAQSTPGSWLGVFVPENTL